MTLLRSGAAAALVALALLLPAAAGAAPGELDPSFRDTGKVAVPFAYSGNVAVQPDGKVLVTGGGGEDAVFSVARLLPNGLPDPEWGLTGVVNTPMGTPALSTAVAVQPDGKVVAVGVAGSPTGDFAIVRYLPNGSLDATFGGGDGVVTLPVGPDDDVARAVDIGPGGRIAISGDSRVPPSKDAAAVAMLEANGTPEAAFAGDGTTLVETESGEDDRGEGIAFQADGKVVIADSTGAGIGDGFTIVRLGLDGAPDPSFGGDGVVETPIPGEGGIEYGRVSDVVIQPDGKIVGGGYGADYGGTPPEYTGKFALARYLTNGELDPTFGSEGIFSVRLTGGDAFGRSLGLAASGKLVLGGTWEPPSGPTESRYAPALLRVTSNGSLDPSFGSGGIVEQTPMTPFVDESLEGLAMAPGGKIVTAGEGYPAGSESFVVVSRFFGDPEGPPPPPNAAPHAEMKKVPHKVGADQLKGFRGTASDPDGTVAKVQISLVRRGQGKKKRPLKPKHWRTAKGTAKWTFKLPHQLKPGRYVVFARAIDNQGLAEEGFSRRDRNRYAFRVLSASSSSNKG